MITQLMAPFINMQNLWWHHYFSSLSMENTDDPRLVNSPYQTKYMKNYEALKTEFKSTLSQNISFVALKKCLTSHFETYRYNY